MESRNSITSPLESCDEENFYYEKLIFEGKVKNERELIHIEENLWKIQMNI